MGQNQAKRDKTFSPMPNVLKGSVSLTLMMLIFQEFFIMSKKALINYLFSFHILASLGSGNLEGKQIWQ